MFATTFTVLWRREAKHFPACLVFVALIGVKLALVVAR
jgi:hypothetical protein